MVKETKYLLIRYDNLIENEIEKNLKELEKKIEKAIIFFELGNKYAKAGLKIYSSLDDFRKKAYETFPHYKKIEDIPMWVCGFIENDTIYTLSLEELKKTIVHDKSTDSDWIKLIIHEFVHICQRYISNLKKYPWIKEGMATYLAGQHQQYDYSSFDATLEQLTMGGTRYFNYYLMFKYVYEKYGKEYIVNLFKDDELLEKETPKLYKELIKYEKRNYDKSKKNGTR